MKIAPKVTSKYDLGVTENAVKTLTIVLCGVLPAFIIALAVYIFIKRKNK
jgi:putative effector of murein hydrolase